MAHGGGYLPAFAARAEHCAVHARRSCGGTAHSPSEYLRRLHVDSVVFDGEALRHLVATVGAERVLLGSDFPAAMGNASAVDHVLRAPGLSDAERIAILGGNAAALLGLGPERALGES
jgi:aminocarboxymuconate-semialdehyde decarboxylase